MAGGSLGCEEPRSLGGGTRRGGRGHQPGRTQCELPVRRGEPSADPRFARRLDADRRGGDRCRQEAAQGLASSSTATIYAHRFDAPNDELTGIVGGTESDAPDTWRFSTEVARAWEEALEQASTPHTRKVALRSAMVMSPGRGGIFDTLLGLVRKGLGGTSGSGRQFVSWIHEADFVAAIDWLIAHEELSGAVNIPGRIPCRTPTS